MQLDNFLGIHESALKFRNERAAILAENIVNADTPGYKAKDIDFSEALKAANSSSRMVATDKKHFNLEGTEGFRTQNRVPLQKSNDGNTVDSQVEIAAFSENSMRYLASLRFIDHQLKGIMTAVKGE